MTTTVEIPEEFMERTMRAAAASTPSEAVMKALQEFVDRHDQRELIPLLGTFSDEFFPPGELDRSREDK